MNKKTIAKELVELAKSLIAEETDEYAEYMKEIEKFKKYFGIYTVSVSPLFYKGVEISGFATEGDIISVESRNYANLKEAMKYAAEIQNDVIRLYNKNHEMGTNDKVSIKQALEEVKDMMNAVGEGKDSQFFEIKQSNSYFSFDVKNWGNWTNYKGHYPTLSITSKEKLKDIIKRVGENYHTVDLNFNVDAGPNCIIEVFAD